jgi:hypothetical protein
LIQEHCRAIFVTPLEQYNEHMLEAPNQTGKESQFSRFHLRLKTSKFQETLRSFLVHEQGVGAVDLPQGGMHSQPDESLTQNQQQAQTGQGQKEQQQVKQEQQEGKERVKESELLMTVAQQQEIEEILQRLESVKYRDFEDVPMVE